MPTSSDRTRWVSYLRVSTAEQAERALSITAQRHAVCEFAARHGAVIDHEFVEPGASGTDPQSELNGLRTSAAMREAVRQGFYPGARPPYGYRSVPVEVRPPFGPSGPAPRDHGLR